LIPRTTTAWPQLAVLLCAGIAVAFQVGKVPPAVVALHDTLGIGALSAAWVISLFAVIGTLSGVAFGHVADRIGHRRAVLGGLVCMALASAAGSLCTSLTPLLITRVLEGFGFFGIAVGMPPLIGALTAPVHRRLALGIWSSYMPLGIALALAIAPPILAAGGWPGLWRVAAVAVGAAAVAVALVVRVDAEPIVTAPLWTSVRTVVAAGSPLAAGFTFAAYTAIYFAVAGFMPTVLVAAGASTGVAAGLSAVVALLNGGGNILAGVAARRFARFTILRGSFVIAAAGGATFFLPGVPLPLRVVAIGVGMCAAGMIPGTITGSIIALAPAPNLISTTQGLVAQLSSAGQLAGPPLIAVAGAERGGLAGALVLVGLALIGVTSAALLRASARR
jgi:predicted MFS family arabinose efflux permease